MTNKMSFEFVPVDKLNCLYDVREIQGRPNRVYQFFLKNDDEVLYITTMGGVYGLISIGDMFRYYERGEKEVPINQEFSYIEDAEDYAGAEAFFVKVKSIHEIPVIKAGRLLGVIRRNQDVFSEGESDRGKLKERLETVKKIRSNKDKNRRIAIKKSRDLSNLLNYGTVLVYSMPDVCALTEDDREVLRARHLLKEFIMSANYEKMSKIEQENFLEKYTREKYMAKFIQALLDTKEIKVSMRNGIHQYEDCYNETFHITNGYRETTNTPQNAKKKIWMFGPCTVFGAYVGNDETIASYLQQFILDHGYNNYEVVNAGMYGAADTREAWFVTEISSDDIVIIVDRFCFAEEGTKYKNQEKSIQYKGDLSEAFLEVESVLEHIFNTPYHCDAFINQKIAKRMYADLLPSLTRDNSDAATRHALQDYFVSDDVVTYYENYAEEYDLFKEPDKKIGAVVVNCNPFTYGHRYLIEYASNQVDILYVFVVEEDRSYFKFADRLEMVKQGTRNLKKVRVLPSGKYIISEDTFAQYFTKDQIVTEVDDMDYDVHIFGAVVADILGITCRFVGEEPMDKVTGKYNEALKRILPEYHVELVEIPRKEQDGNVISASQVRKYLEQRNMEKVREFVPQSTVDICRKYM